MIWVEQFNRKEKKYTYSCEDYFGELTLETNTRLDKHLLDTIQMNITKGKGGENNFVVKTKGGIIELYYKFIKNEKSLWEKTKPEESLSN